jgi:hypothetical protein
LLGSVNLTDFSDFAGSGSNDFFVTPFGPVATETFDASGTVTETIFTSVPEPSTWAMMLIGFSGLGWLARARRRDRIAGVTFRQAACGRPVPESRAVRATVAEVYFVNRCKYLVHVV